MCGKVLSIKDATNLIFYHNNYGSVKYLNIFIWLPEIIYRFYGLKMVSRPFQMFTGFVSYNFSSFLALQMTFYHLILLKILPILQTFFLEEWILFGQYYYLILFF